MQFGMTDLQFGMTDLQFGMTDLQFGMTDAIWYDRSAHMIFVRIRRSPKVAVLGDVRRTSGREAAEL
jgi:hypothetical protein